MDTDGQLATFKKLVDHLAADLEAFNDQLKLQGLNYLFAVIKPQIEKSAFTELAKSKLILNNAETKLLLKDKSSPAPVNVADDVWQQFPILWPGRFNESWKTQKAPNTGWKRMDYTFSQSDMSLLALTSPPEAKYFLETESEDDLKIFKDDQFKEIFDMNDIEFENYNDSQDSQSLSPLGDIGSQFEMVGSDETFKSQIVYETQSSDTCVESIDTGPQNACDEDITDFQPLEGKTLPSSKDQRKKFTCQFCEKIYYKRKSLILHFASMHPNRCHDCLVVCGSTVKDKVKHNSEVHIDELPFVCNVCGDNFRRNQQYQAHLAAHSRQPKKKYPCPQCDEVYYRLNLLRAHVKEVHNKTKVAVTSTMCEVCGLSFENTRSLQQHNRRVHKNVNNEFKCKHCPATFAIKSNLERHVQLHNELVKSFICELCGNSYFTEGSLREHITSSHDFNVTKYECKVCHREYTHQRLLDAHAVSHSKDRPFSCDTCGNQFKRRPHLKRHKMMMHDTENPKRYVDRLKPNDKGELVPIKEPFMTKNKSSPVKLEATEAIKVYTFTSPPSSSALDIPNQFVTEQMAADSADMKYLPFSNADPIADFTMAFSSVPNITYQSTQFSGNNMFQVQNVWTTNSIDSQMNLSGDSSQSVCNASMQSVIKQIKMETDIKTEPDPSSNDAEADVSKTINDSELDTTTSDIQLFNPNIDFPLPGSGGCAFDFANSENQAKAIADISDALQKECAAKDLESFQPCYIITQIGASSIKYDEASIDQMAQDQQGELPQFFDYIQSVAE